jgi:hypothetical protein
MEEEHKRGSSIHHPGEHAGPDSGTEQGNTFYGDELKSRLSDDPDSIGLDLDGTNPGSRSHPVDYDTLDDQ